jgi:hypothetical protein
MPIAVDPHADGAILQGSVLQFDRKGSVRRVFHFWTRKTLHTAHGEVHVIPALATAIHYFSSFHTLARLSYLSLIVLYSAAHRGLDGAFEFDVSRKVVDGDLLA